MRIRTQFLLFLYSVAAQAFGQEDDITVLSLSFAPVTTPAEVAR